VNCGQPECEEEVVFTFTWPGKWVSQATCLRHAQIASGIAAATGFKLEFGLVVVELAHKVATVLAEAEDI